VSDISNFYSSLHTAMSRREVAGLFAAAGWEVIEPDDWDHLEVHCPWAELVIEAESPILKHGTVADLPTRAEELVAPLRVAGVSFTAECYGPEPDRELLLELRS
jgi:hypothetical protein